MRYRIQAGVTLLEMMLVIVVMSSMIYMAVGYFQRQAMEQKVVRTAQQMQQFLIAAATFYVANNRWPNDIAALRVGSGYISYDVDEKSSWGGAYYGTNSTATNFYINVPITMATPTLANTYARFIADRLPIGFVAATPNATSPSTCNATTCYAIGQIGIPAQSLNNAVGINFAGIYRHGGCIPVPDCNVAGMKPQVFVVPISVSGMNTESGGAVYPISSFTAYATGPSFPPEAPPACKTGRVIPCGTIANVSKNGKYWRACLQVVTERGDTSTTNLNWGRYVTLGAFTRCAPATEPYSGSDFTVFSD